MLQPVNALILKAPGQFDTKYFLDGSQVSLGVSFLGFLTLWPRQLWPSGHTKFQIFYGVGFLTVFKRCL